MQAAKLLLWKERAHHLLAIGSAAVGVVTGAATGIADVANMFGAHISGTDVTSKVAVASGAILFLSKAIDSLNNIFAAKQ